MTYLKAAAVIVVALFLFGFGYKNGFSVADAARRAEVAGLQAESAEARAKAETKARERLEEEVRRGDALAEQLTGVRKQLAAQTKDITRRIKNAARSAAGCRFGPDFVRLYNEALGYGAADLPQDSGAACADRDPGPSPAAGAGVLHGRPVTPEDLLAHVRDYGAWAQGLRAQLRALGEFAREGR